MSRYRREIAVAMAYLALLGLLAVAAPRFYRGDQLARILVGNAPILVASVGMTLVILTRQIDISIGSQLSICGVVAGLLARSGVPMPLVVPLTIACGASMGLLNGWLVSGLGLPSIVVTLATMVIGRESLRWWREGEFVRNLPADFQWFGAGQGAGQWAIVGIAAGVWLAAALALKFLAAGRSVYATGSDPEAARLAGLGPRRVVMLAFVAMGALTGLAALLSALQLPQVDPMAGNGLELQVIAPVVVGGVAVSGGRGTLAGVLMGVLLLGTIGAALVFLGTEAYWSKAIQGAIILLAVASDGLSEKGRAHGVVAAGA
ncbi:MAG: ABC transporter permease [Isosphaeraceae bacterium]